MKFILKFSDSFINFVSLLVLATLVISNSIFMVNVSYNVYEVVSYKFSLVYPLFGFLFVLFLYVYIQKSLSKITENNLFLFFSILYFLLAIYFILNTKSFIRADSMAVYSSALEFNNKDYTSLMSGNYLSIYPNQLGLLTYDRLLTLIYSNEKILYFSNCVLVIVISRFLYKISEFIFSDPFINKLTIILSFLFLPQFYFIMFAYGLIPGFAFLIIAIYYSFLFVKEKNVKHALIVLICTCISVNLKNNYLIGFIAIFIYIFLNLLKTKNLKLLLFIILLTITTLGSKKVLNYHYERESGLKISEGCPMNLWIAMGTDLDNELRGPGWFNGYNRNVYLSTNLDYDMSKEIGNLKIVNNLLKIKSEPLKFVKFYSKKIVSMWTDPLFQSVWSGPSFDSEEKTSSVILLSLYCGRKLDAVSKYFMKGYVISLLVFNLIFIKKYIKNHHSTMILYLYFIGGFLFHLFWEAKSQYVYTYIIVLIPMFSFAFKKTINQVTYTKSINKNN